MSTFIRALIQVAILVGMLLGRTSHTMASSSSTPYYDSIYQVMTTTTNETDFRSFYEVIGLDAQFPENLKYELILITTNRAKELGFDHSYACGLFYHSIHKSIVGQYGEAISMISTSIEILKVHHDYLQLSGCYNTLGSTLTANGDAEAGKKYLRKALEINKLVDPSKRKTLQHINNLIVLGYVYYNAHELDSAELFTRQALEVAHKNSSREEGDYNLYLEKAYSYINLGKFQLKRNHYHEAVRLYKKGLNICKKGAYEGLEATFYHRIGQAYKAMKDRSNALWYFDEGIRRCRSYFAILPIWLDLLKIKAQTLEELGKYAEVVEVQKKHMALKDSLNDITKEKELQKLIIEFEVEQKNLEIATLNQQATIQSLQLAQRNNQLIGIGLLCIMMVLGGFLYYRQYTFKKERATYELEQRFLRSQLNPHFIFNSMTTIQHYMLHTDTENAAHYMGMFSTLMRQILENSREEFIPLQEEVSMLHNYIELQRIRFSEPFSYQIEVDEAIDDAYHGVPPMFAQPFIENAFEHGLFKEDGKENMLSIRFSMVNTNQILLTIEDSGIGIQQQIPRHSKDHKSMATTITEERLHNLNHSHKQKYWITYQNLMGAQGLITGCKVTLTLPIKMFSYP